MVAFALFNLVVPETSASFDLRLGTLTWNISPLNDYNQRVQRLRKEPLYMATFEQRILRWRSRPRLVLLQESLWGNLRYRYPKKYCGTTVAEAKV